MVCWGITPKYNDESDELILGQTCIRNNLVLLENGRLHAPRKITEKWLKKYDLLTNSTGVGSLGRTAQVWFDPSKLVVNSHVTIVRAADPRRALYMGFWAFEHSVILNLFTPEVRAKRNCHAITCRQFVLYFPAMQNLKSSTPLRSRQLS